METWKMISDILSLLFTIIIDQIVGKAYNILLAV
jgi:hypothetical protein